MFVQVFIVQCKSTGEFMMRTGAYTYNLNRAGYFLNKQSAIDTAMLALDDDFLVFDFYKRDFELPLSHVDNALGDYFAFRGLGFTKLVRRCKNDAYAQAQRHFYTFTTPLSDALPPPR